ncbi:DUF6048 family protein [Ichthyenterobacterium sp. W332]|uniref:DUF6048 family protein n=1 Tax=Microcosmobacter mediterraneus TaxID=3075607 RepID=A0ABU2YJL6_9FLAO|nr:DUF6048 family protein [Ichthyenterobacterium sp. W332]MDT0557425.1 DUF6048 family protein [Ichthyenterobacterium sp. W332]
MKRTFLFTTKLMLILLCCSTLMAQETKTDSIVYKQDYGFRLGGDIYKLVRTVVDDDYTGFEINGDYRLTKRWYLAGELGTEDKRTTTDFLDVTTTGSYFKAGVDYNFYRNWLNMENMLFGGFRVGVSSFKQQLDSFTIYDVNNTLFGQYSSVVGQEFNGLTAIWVEVLFGMKAEVLNNLYMGLNVQLKGLVSLDEPSNFENVYIPGFNKTFDSGRFGVGFGYNISYLIPIFKKDKTVKVIGEE